MYTLCIGTRAFVPSYRQLSARTLPIHLGGPSVKLRRGGGHARYHAHSCASSRFLFPFPFGPQTSRSSCSVAPPTRPPITVFTHVPTKYARRRHIYIYIYMYTCVSRPRCYIYIYIILRYYSTSRYASGGEQCFCNRAVCTGIYIHLSSKTERDVDE